MERFSNSREAYWDQIKSELCSDNFETCVFRYLEMGQLLQHGYSISQLQKSTDTLIIRYWKAAYDAERFDKGIYNLDRLAIEKKEVKLTQPEVFFIQASLKEKFDLTNWGGIVLDGYYRLLETDDQEVIWNIESEINEPLIAFTRFLQELANKHAPDGSCRF